MDPFSFCVTMTIGVVIIVLREAFERNARAKSSALAEADASSKRCSHPPVALVDVRSDAFERNGLVATLCMGCDTQLGPEVWSDLMQRELDALLDETPVDAPPIPAKVKKGTDCSIDWAACDWTITDVREVGDERRFRVDLAFHETGATEGIIFENEAAYRRWRDMGATRGDPRHDGVLTSSVDRWAKVLESPSWAAGNPITPQQVNDYHEIYTHGSTVPVRRAYVPVLPDVESLERIQRKLEREKRQTFEANQLGRWGLGEEDDAWGFEETTVIHEHTRVVRARAAERHQFIMEISALVGDQMMTVTEGIKAIEEYEAARQPLRRRL